jgi:WS/DGAT/MGAT family acyltransferase
MFLRFENPKAHMHVGALLLFEAGPLATSKGVDVARIRRYLAAQLAQIPRYRQRLHPSPIDGQPVWVDDDRFDLTAHVRHLRLAAPGTDQDLLHLSGRVMSQHLDRNRPLWELWVVDGLRNGQFAMISKIHHCMVDGIAGADLLRVLLSPTAQTNGFRASRWLPRPTPAPLTLLRDRFVYQAETVSSAMRELTGVVRHPSRAFEWGRSGKVLWDSLGSGFRPAPDSPFNRPIGATRGIAWQSVELSTVKAVKNELGGTVNDVVLATVAGTLRRFLLRRDPDADLVDLRALVPVSTRAPMEAHSLGNHVAAWLMPLPVSEADPRRRFERIRDMTAALKGSKEVLGARLLSEGGSALIGLGARLLEWLRPFNVVITNVPGPPIPLYLQGARLKHVVPLVPLFPNQGVGVAVLSYSDKLCWGLNTDRHVIPDRDALGSALAGAFDELVSAAKSIRRPPKLESSRLRRASL